MDEGEFNRVLNLFPIVRSRDYHFESEVSKQSSRSGINQLSDSEWHDAWSEEDKKDSDSECINPSDPFWEKLKLAAEKKAGTAKAERFCKTFQSVHKKLVCELGKDAATQSFSNLSSLD
ncbi:hypothetical protein ACHQM5_013150 [Ranunculus cassubicifolius]